MLAVNATLLARVLADGPLAMTMGRWLPPFGITFAADALGAASRWSRRWSRWSAPSSAARDIDTTGRRYGFYPFLMLLMAGVSGAFLTGDIFNLYVWFEVMLIASFGLLVLGSAPSRSTARRNTAFLNLLATTLFLVAPAYLYGPSARSTWPTSRRRQPARDPAPLTTIAALFLLAFGMKAAAFPVNFWLPASYHAPRIVTSALFGGLLTKVGVYALLRTLVMLFPVERLALSRRDRLGGGATMILGALGALAQSDIRRMLGFLVISGIGVMLSGWRSAAPRQFLARSSMRFIRCWRCRRSTCLRG